jgi:predicted NUDIX family phosphoesterase
LSVGVGGHVEQEDATGTADLQATLKNCLLRELKEELLFDGTPELKLLGFVNDESVDAGRFHMAAVYLAKFAPGRVRVRPEVSDQEFGTKSWAMVEPEKITREISSFDPWSQHIIAHLWKVPLPTRASQGFISYSGESSQPK